jgi:hypothetical protein
MWALDGAKRGPIVGDRLLITAGDVIDVQLTSETIMVEGANQGRGKRRQARTATRTLKRMRVFLRDSAGKEMKFDLAETNLGVRDGHRCAVVHGRCPGLKDPAPLMLANLSTDERETFDHGVAAYLRRRRFFGPLWKAFFASLLMTAFGVFYSQIILGHHDSMSVLESLWWAGFFSFLTYPVFWWLAAMWEQMTERARFRRGRAQLLADIEAGLRAHRQTPPSPAPSPAT